MGDAWKNRPNVYTLIYDSDFELRDIDIRAFRPGFTQVRDMGEGIFQAEYFDIERPIINTAFIDTYDLSLTSFWFGLAPEEFQFVQNLRISSRPNGEFDPETRLIRETFAEIDASGQPVLRAHIHQLNAPPTGR